MNDWTTLFDPANPIKTPNLVRLARRGMFFSKAYCAAPACCPSRAAIMTGIRPSNSGVYDNNHAWAKMMPDAVTLSGGGVRYIFSVCLCVLRGIGLVACAFAQSPSGFAQGKQ